MLCLVQAAHRTGDQGIEASSLADSWFEMVCFHFDKWLAQYELECQRMLPQLERDLKVRMPPSRTKAVYIRRVLVVLWRLKHLHTNFGGVTSL